MRKRIIAIPIAAGFACAALAAQAATYEPSTITPPALMREFRGAWIASVANIDWPSRPGLSSQAQKAELINILDAAQRAKLNAVILQVRPACDAMYSSSIEPWSEYLTGTMGQAPQPFYDPLAFAVQEAHKRGLELHAWFNPYRARHNAAKSPVSSGHVSKKHPELVRQYGKYLWLDPGEKAVQDYSLRVVMDVVQRYDIDGVHFDDYFYPYKEKDASGNDIPFPDDASWTHYGTSGHLSRDDWRRDNVNTFIRRVYEAIKGAKPWVKFGVSPFGIWRPGSPPQIKGYDAYSQLYADSRKWLAEGWLDYFAPQLYWSIDSPEQSFPVLLGWWSEQNSKGRWLLPGLDTTKTKRAWKPEEIVNQIRLARGKEGVCGHIHWNVSSLIHNPSLEANLDRDLYAAPSLMPAMPWLAGQPPARPEVSAKHAAGGAVRVSWPAERGHAWLWIVQTKVAGQWQAQVLPVSASFTTVSGQPEYVALTAVDRLGNTSAPAVLQLGNRSK